MRFDFDRIIDRRGTNSIKHDFGEEMGKTGDLIPLWVADMDFEAPPCVKDALGKIVEHGIHGYGNIVEEYASALAHWMERRFGWKIQPEWNVKTSGIVFAVYTAVRAFTKAGQAVMIQQPVYHPFQAAVEDTGRKLVNNPLIYQDGRYTMDLVDFEEKIIKNKVKLLILCSPHNPVGRVWTREELEAMGDICLKHGVLVVSDEIHADFVFPGHTHHIFASLKPEFAEISVICTAPSKTFNVAGLQDSNILIPNPVLREEFQDALGRIGYHGPTVMAQAACMAVYREGAEWLDELLVYLKDSVDYVRSFLKDRIPKIKLVEPEGMFLLWLDCSALGLESEALDAFFTEKAGLWLNMGSGFGLGGERFMRLNIGCPRSVLEQALTQLEKAVNGLA